MKDSYFADLELEEDNITVEEFLKLQCKIQIDKFMKHYMEKSNAFRLEATKVRKEMEEMVGKQPPV